MWKNIYRNLKQVVLNILWFKLKIEYIEHRCHNGIAQIFHSMFKKFKNTSYIEIND